MREEQKDGDWLFIFTEFVAYTICIQNISMIYQNWNGFPFILSMEQRTLECISKFKMYRISSTLSSVYSIVCGINCIHSKYSYEIPKPWWITIALSMEHRTEMYFLTFELKFPLTINGNNIYRDLIQKVGCTSILLKPRVSKIRSVGWLNLKHPQS